MSGWEERRGLHGREVAVTGRLASMTRAEARARIREAGGRVVRRPTEETAVLVVGEGGPPLGDDGRLTRSLRIARGMQARGHPIRIVTEEDLVASLGLEDRQGELRRLYTTEELARVLGIRPSLVRYWVRQGLVAPAREIGRLLFFDFQQVASAKALHQLTSEGVTAGAIRRSLEKLAGWLPRAEQAIAQLEVLERSGRVLVRTDEGRLAEPTGQLLMDFGDAGGADDADRGGPRPDEDDDAPSGPLPLRVLPRAVRGDEEWFELGVLAESEGRLEDAEAAYRHALEAGADRPETWFNLGNTLYARDRKREAAACYRRALELAPDYVEVWNNLGNALGELGDPEESILCYRKALAIAPEYLDARYNLAETLAQEDRLAEARDHWLAYLDLDPTSAFARLVRARLAGGSPTPPPTSPVT